ncbi:MAG: hypothetical protein GY953_02135, partial [bacterium]|nr:hypothetical protein [bacterium]
MSRLKFANTTVLLNLAVLLAACGAGPEAEPEAMYQPTWESIRTHEAPE